MERKAAEGQRHSFPAWASQWPGKITPHPRDVNILELSEICIPQYKTRRFPITVKGKDKTEQRVETRTGEGAVPADDTVCVADRARVLHNGRPCRHHRRPSVRLPLTLR